MICNFVCAKYEYSNTHLNVTICKHTQRIEAGFARMIQLNPIGVPI